jgi:hypothetical protein
MNRHIFTSAVIFLVFIFAGAQPQISFNGYLDADFWSDLEGAFFTNSELDLGLFVKFTEKVSANVYATVLSANSGSGRGFIPGGNGMPQERWVNVAFDGFDITYKSQLGTFSVGDLVYQFGTFNYYLYKRLSMITEESFTRGIKYEIQKGNYSQSILTGVADLNESTGDVMAVSGFDFSDDNSLYISYGIRGDVKSSFKTGSDLFMGGSYNSSIGSMISLKADFGYSNISGENRKNLFTILFEPSLEVNQFTTDLIFYMLFDPDSANNLNDPLFGIPDEFLVYIEPGYKLTDKAKFGLPLEFHGAELDNNDDNSFWVVPTFYLFPSENVQWLLWGMVTVAVQKNISSEDLSYGLGSEIIVSF